MHARGRAAEWTPALQWAKALSTRNKRGRPMMNITEQQSAGENNCTFRQREELRAFFSGARYRSAKWAKKPKRRATRTRDKARESPVPIKNITHYTRHTSKMYLLFQQQPSFAHLSLASAYSLLRQAFFYDALSLSHPHPVLFFVCFLFFSFLLHNAIS